MFTIPGLRRLRNPRFRHSSTTLIVLSLTAFATSAFAPAAPAVPAEAHRISTRKAVATRMSNQNHPPLKGGVDSAATLSLHPIASERVACFATGLYVGLPERVK